MRIIAVGVHLLVHLRVQNLDQAPHVGEMTVHGVAVGEILDHSLHKVAEARVGKRFVVERY